MRIVVYRDRETKNITQHHKFTDACTDGNIKAWNENPNNNTFVEVVELEENSVAYYFFNLKIQSRKDYYEDLRNLEEQLRDIASDIDDRLSKLEDLCYIEEKENERD